MLITPEKALENQNVNIKKGHFKSNLHYSLKRMNYVIASAKQRSNPVSL